MTTSRRMLLHKLDPSPGLSNSGTSKYSEDRDPSLDILYGCDEETKGALIRTAAGQLVRSKICFAVYKRAASRGERGLEQLPSTYHKECDRSFSLLTILSLGVSYRKFPTHTVGIIMGQSHSEL